MIRVGSSVKRLCGGGARALLFVVGCAWAQHVPVDASEKNASPYSTKEFVARVLGSTEDVGDELFKATGHSPYPQPTVVIFSEKTRSACGLVSSAIGPIYCPTDHKIYLDMASIGELSRRFGLPPSDFALANLLVREVSHHVQTVLGTTVKVGGQMHRRTRADAGTWQCASNCRPTAIPGSGPTSCRSGAYSNQGT